MIIDYEDDGIIKWEQNGEKRQAELEDLIKVYERKLKRGRWIYYFDDKGFQWCKCSECLTSYGCMDTPFCPNCGADMRGGENE